MFFANFIYLDLLSGSTPILIIKIRNVIPPIVIPTFLKTLIISCNASIFYRLLLGSNALKFRIVFPAEFMILPFGLIIYFPSIVGVFTDTTAIAIA